MRIYLTLFFTWLSLSVCGQVSVNFIPELNGRNIDGLLNLQILNPGMRIEGSLTITVSERVAGQVLLIRTPDFSILPGNNPLPGTIVSGSAVQFAASATGRLAASTRSFPQGDYEYCFSLKIRGSDNPPQEQCFSYTLEPFADMTLIDPYNKDIICDKRPLFTWQPLLPGVPGAYYQLVLSEVKSGQSPTEALNYNLPVINQRNIISPVLPYPPIAPELENKKKYAWQVTAYKDQTILSRSDIWDFTLDCKDSVKKEPDLNISYRDVEDLTRGNLYVAKGYIHFSIVNPYGAQQMNYTVHPADDHTKAIKGMEKFTLQTGDNYITIDLTQNSRFKNGKYYIMDIHLPNGTVKNLRFLYEQIKD